MGGSALPLLLPDSSGSLCLHACIATFAACWSLSLHACMCHFCCQTPAGVFFACMCHFCCLTPGGSLSLHACAARLPASENRQDSELPLTCTPFLIGIHSNASTNDEKIFGTDLRPKGKTVSMSAFPSQLMPSSDWHIPVSMFHISLYFCLDPQSFLYRHCIANGIYYRTHRRHSHR